MDYQPVVVKTHRRSPGSKHSAESRYWRQFRHPVFVKEYAPITSVHFSPSRPHRYAVTAATRVQIYAPRTQKLTKTISRFKDVARSGCIREDGKLVVAGDDSGLIQVSIRIANDIWSVFIFNQVFDINSRAILRTLDSHKQPVHVTKFSSLSPTHILSCSDDTTVKFWDVPSQTPITTFTDHTDYVRSGQVSTSNPNLIMTGSYDSTVRLFDARTGHCEMFMASGSTSSLSDRAPVEQVLMFPSGTIALSTSGPILRVWDLVAGGRCTRALSNHQKTVTALAFNSTGDRLLTGSLDQMVKVYDISTYKVVHTMRYPAPVLCLSISVREYAVTVIIKTDSFTSLTIRISSEACPMAHYPSVGEIPKPVRSSRTKCTPVYLLSCQALISDTAFCNKRLLRKAVQTRANYAWRRKRRRNWRNMTSISRTSNILLLLILSWKRSFRCSSCWF